MPHRYNLKATYVAVSRLLTAHFWDFADVSSATIRCKKRGSGSDHELARKWARAQPLRVWRGIRFGRFRAQLA